MNISFFPSYSFILLLISLLNWAYKAVMWQIIKIEMNKRPKAVEGYILLTWTKDPNTSGGLSLLHMRRQNDRRAFWDHSVLSSHIKDSFIIDLLFMNHTSPLHVVSLTPRW